MDGAKTKRKKMLTFSLKERDALHEEARALGLLSRTIVDTRCSALRLVHKTRVKHGELVCDAKDLEKHGLRWYRRYAEPMRIHVQAWLEPTMWVEVGPASSFKGGNADRLVLTDAPDPVTDAEADLSSHCAEFKGFLFGGECGGLALHKDDLFRVSFKRVLRHLHEELKSRMAPLT
jgi:hypothetical protein